MKHLFIAIVALITLASCKQTKIGYVDVAKMMKEYEAVKDLEKEMEEKSAAFQAKYQQLAAEIDQQVKQGKLGGAQAQQKGQELQMSYQQEGQQLQKESQDRSDKVVDDLKAFVKEYAQKNGYNFIFGSNDSGNVLYGDEKADLTDTLIDAINEDYENGSKDAKKEAKAEDKSTTDKDTAKTADKK